MRRRWIGKNVDLALLSEYLEGFLEGRGYRTKRDRMPDGYGILGTPKPSRGLGGGVVVRVVGDSDDFAVELMAGGRTHASMMWGYMTTLFGGGSFLLQGLKSKEALERLETEFWVHAEKMLERLIGTARR